MKSVLIGWLLGLGLLASHFGCCSIRMVGDGCEGGRCGGMNACGMNACGTLRSRIANRIASTNCSSGCGEIYWDEHINEPPVCDPCGCDGEFECGGGGRNCPSVLQRLRGLWGYCYYVPSNCSECSSGTNVRMHGNDSCSCATCAGNTQADHATGHQSTISNHSKAVPSSDDYINHGAPTPASKPRPQRAPAVAPTPFPDSNAMYRQDDQQYEEVAIGSGVTPQDRRTVAKPVSSNARQALQSKPRLVTNPR